MSELTSGKLLDDYCTWVLGLLPPMCSCMTLSSPFERISIVQKLVSFLAEEEGMVFPSKVKTQSWERGLYLWQARDQEFNFPAKLSRAQPCNAEGLMQGSHPLQGTWDQAPSSHWFLWRSALLCGCIFFGLPFAFADPLPHCPGTH